MHIFRLRSLIVVLFCMTLAIPLAEARRQRPGRKPARKARTSTSSITRERSSKQDELSRLKREIADFQRQLQEHEANAVRSRKNLSSFDKRSAQLKKAIAELEARVDALEEKKEVVEDSIRTTTTTLDHLKSAYAAGVRYLYVNGALARESGDERMLGASQADEHDRQEYYAGLVARAHAMNRERLDSARRALGITKQGINNALATSTRAIDQRANEEQTVESKKQEETRHLAQIEQDRERVRRILQQKQASARRLERMIADLIMKEEKAARARREAAVERSKKAAKSRAGAHAGTPREKTPKFEDDLAEPGRVYGPHSLHWPTTSHQIRQGYGEHRNAELNTVTMNLGVDIAATEGSPVYSAADGIVSLVSSLPSYGTIIVLQHASGLHTVYADLSTVGVRVGSRVTAGQVIGRSGANEELGSVLHFEVWKGKSRQNPIGWLR